MIAFDRVTSRRAGRLVLDDVSLTVEPDAFVLVVGANGAGKTTLLQHVNGILAPDRGTVSVDGHDTSADVAAARQAVGMVFQEPRDQLVGTTVETDVAFGPENLGLDRTDIEDRVADALDAVGMDDADSRRVETLSHGERTRVAIAGALAMRPSYLALDEPLVGLDARGRSGILERIVAANRDDTGVLLATHDVRDVYDHADRVLGLAGGRLVIDAAPADARSGLDELGVRPPPAP